MPALLGAILMQVAGEPLNLCSLEEDQYFEVLAEVDLLAWEIPDHGILCELVLRVGGLDLVEG